MKGLEDIPSVGKAIALKIEEYIMTGKINYFEQLKARTPINIDDFNSLEGIGPKTFKVLYDKLKSKDISATLISVAKRFELQCGKNIAKEKD